MVASLTTNTSSWNEKFTAIIVFIQKSAAPGNSQIKYLLLQLQGQ